MSEVRPGARLLAGAGSPDDTGAGDEALTAALAAYAEESSPEREAVVLEALAGARLLVPVVALLTETETGADGLQRDKSSDMAAVLMRGSDGRTALLAFTSLEAMHRWDPEARPVPVPAPIAAQSAMQDGADALIIDTAGPVRFVAAISQGPISQGPIS